MRRKKFDEEAQSGDTDPKTHFLHQFQQLDIADYAENAEAGVKNLRLRPPHSDWAGGPQDRGENLRRLSRAASVDSSVSAASPAAGGPCLHDGLVLGGSRRGHPAPAAAGLVGTNRDMMWTLLAVVVRLTLDTEYAALISSSALLPFVLTLSLLYTLGWVVPHTSTVSSLLSAGNTSNNKLFALYLYL